MNISSEACLQLRLKFPPSVRDNGEMKLQSVFIWLDNDELPNCFDCTAVPGGLILSNVTTGGTALIFALHQIITLKFEPRWLTYELKYIDINQQREERGITVKVESLVLLLCFYIVELSSTFSCIWQSSSVYTFFRNI